MIKNKIKRRIIYSQNNSYFVNIYLNNDIKVLPKYNLYEEVKEQDVTFSFDSTTYTGGTGLFYWLFTLEIEEAMIAQVQWQATGSTDTIFQSQTAPSGITYLNEVDTIYNIFIPIEVTSGLNETLTVNIIDFTDGLVFNTETIEENINS